MLSKEEIEKAKENITKYLNDIWFGTLYSQEENDRDEKILLEYIDQLESDKQKLIEKLEKRRKQNNNKYDRAIDNDEFPEMYEYSGQVEEDDYLLSIVKGVENERDKI